MGWQPPLSSSQCEYACDLLAIYTAIEHTYRTKTNKVSFITKKLADRYSSYNMLNPVLYRRTDIYCYDGSGSHYSLCRVQSGVYDGNEVHVQSISCYNMHFKIFSSSITGFNIQYAAVESVCAVL